MKRKFVILHYVLFIYINLPNGRILVQVLRIMKDQNKQVQWHIPFKYEKEMSQKSKVVSWAVN